MKRCAGIMLAVTFLALSLWSLAASNAGDDEEDKQAIMDAQKAVQDLVKSMKENKGDVKAKSAAIHKKFSELKNIMWVYKPRTKGGIGMTKNGASIEIEIAKIGNPNSKVNLTPKKIAELKADLIKAGELSQAVAEVTDLYVPKKNTDKWKEYTKDMRKGGEELIQAANSGDAVRIKKAANNLSGSCTNCHSDFRND